ncbi:MAG: hypothetical protein K0R81_2424 [Microbacterium sp.]|nr:hypothetical protein [Microbacterium sp.]
MDVAHLAFDAFPGRLHALGRIRQPRRSREDTKVFGLLGEQGRPAQSAQLQAMFEQAQQPVVAAEGLRLGAADVPLRHEGVQRFERAALPDPLVRESVDELQQLHRELDVTDSPGTQLQLTVHLARGDVVGHALAHALHTLDEVLPRRAVPDEGLHRRDVLGPEL